MKLVCQNCEWIVPKHCFGEYAPFNDDCDRCNDLNRYCKIWKNNMFNFKRKRNLLTFICFIALVVWNTKVGFDLLKTEFKVFAVLDFTAIIFSFWFMKASIKSRKTAIEAYHRTLKTGTSKSKTEPDL